MCISYISNGFEKKWGSTKSDHNVFQPINIAWTNCVEGHPGKHFVHIILESNKQIQWRRVLKFGYFHKNVTLSPFWCHLTNMFFNQSTWLVQFSSGSPKKHFFQSVILKFGYFPPFLMTQQSKFYKEFNFLKRIYLLS